MNGTLSLEQIIIKTQEAFAAVPALCITIPDNRFFESRGEKWSGAQHVRHLVISTKTTTAAYALPKFIVRLVAGRPNRSSRTYDELVEKYRAKLQAGGKASGRYIPKEIKPASKEKLFRDWDRSTQEYIKALRSNWKDAQLDQYIVPHPLLGKITLRELGYFTIYHTYHHMESIRNL
jgi:hypothetical protein